MGYSSFRYRGTWQVPAGVTKATVSFRSTLFRVSRNKASHWVDDGGQLWGVGDAFSGNLGDGTNVSKTTPVQLAPTRQWIACATGEDHGIAIERATGIAYAWGAAGAFDFNMGDGTSLPKSVPTAVVGGRRYVACSVGSGQGAALEKETLNLFMWGANSSGGLGDGTILSKSSPVAVAGFRRVLNFDVGVSHSALIDTNSDLFVWGDNLDGKLGLGTSGFAASVSSPTAVLGARKWLKVSIGNNHMMGLTTNHEVFCWGSNSNGQLGIGGPTGFGVAVSSPVAIAGGRKFIDISASNDQCYAIEKDTFDAFAWGNNIGGSLGVGDIAHRSTPTLVVGGRKFVAIVAGGTGGCFGLLKDTNVPEVGILGWGSNFGGEMGIGSTNSTSSPIAVLGFRDIRSAFPPNIFEIDVVPGASIVVSPTERLFGTYLAPHGESLYDLIEIRWKD